MINKLKHFIKKNKKNIIIIFIVIILSIFGFIFREKIKEKSIMAYNKTYEYFLPKKVVIESEEEKNHDNNIEVLTLISLPSTEKITCSGVSSRESIKIVSDNFREIEYIVPKNCNEVKKGERVLKYKTADMEVRAARLEEDVRLKSQILTRGKQMDANNVISKDEFDKIQIDVANAKGELSEIKQKIEDSLKIAPFDCYIKHHGYINGSFVSNGQEILTILRKDKLFVDINISIQDINKLQEKNLLHKHCKLYFNNNRNCSGKVIYFVNNADPFTASVSAIIEVDDNERKIISGEICSVKIYTGVIDRLFLVPEEAICGDEHDYHVFIIKKNIAYKTPIQRHGKKGEKYLISGPTDGDVLATFGAHRLTNLCKVKI